MDRLKVEDYQGKAHFEDMFGAGIRYFRQSTAIVLFCHLQPKQLRPDNVSSYIKEVK